MGLALSSTAGTIAEKREISIAMQIGEAERDLKVRENPHLRPKGKTPRSQVELLVERQTAIVATLKWMHDNEGWLTVWVLGEADCPRSGVKFQLWARLKEARRELDQRRTWDLAGSARPKQSHDEIARQIERQRDIVLTLKWVQAIRPAFEEWLANRQEPTGQGGAA